MDLIILGTGLLAEVVLDIVADCGGYEVAAFCENWHRDKCSQTLHDRPIIWVEELAQYSSSHRCVCAIGSTHRHQFIQQAASQGLGFETIVHPSCVISRRSRVGEGSIVSPGVVIAPYTAVGRHVFINRGVLIGHHSFVSDFVSIQPGCNIAGKVNIGERAYIGMGSIVLDGRSVGEEAVVGAGALVTKDVPERVQVMGVPAKIVKTNISGR